MWPCQPIQLRRSGSRRTKHLLKPPVGNKTMAVGNDFIVMVVGGPNQRTDFHVDPYEEWFYQLRGNMHVDVIVETASRRPCTSSEGETWLLPGNTPHSPQRPEAGSIGLVIERIREEGTLEKFQWYCPNCNALVHEVELQVRDIVDRPAAGVRGVLRRRAGADLQAAAPCIPGRGPVSSGRLGSSTCTPTSCRAAGRSCPAPDPPWLRIDSERDAMIMRGDEEFRRIRATAGTPAVRLADMDADGVAVAGRVADAGVLRVRARAGRGHPDRARSSTIWPWTSAPPRPDRLVPFCQVPLQDTDAACAELERCLAAGHARRGDRQPRRRSRPGRRRASSPSCSTARRLGRSGVRPSVGHADVTAAATGGWRSGSPACPPRPTCRSWPWCSAASSTGSTGSLRICFAHGGGSFALLARPDGQRLAPPTGRHRHIAVSAVALRRPVLGRFGGLRRARAAAAGRDDGARSGHGRQRLPVPVRRAPGRRMSSAPARFLDEPDDGRQFCSGNALRFLGASVTNGVPGGRPVRIARSRTRRQDVEFSRRDQFLVPPPRAAATPTRPTSPATRWVCSPGTSAPASTRNSTTGRGSGRRGAHRGAAALGVATTSCSASRRRAWSARCPREVVVDELADGQPAPDDGQLLPAHRGAARDPHRGHAPSRPTATRCAARPRFHGFDPDDGRRPAEAARRARTRLRTEDVVDFLRRDGHESRWCCSAR